MCSRCNVKNSSCHAFETYLIMPIQRIPRYKQMLERLLCNSEEEDLHLKKAVKEVSQAASLINETIRQHENLEALLVTQAKFSGSVNLFTNNRRLIRQGKLLKVCIFISCVLSVQKCIVCRCLEKGSRRSSSISLMILCSTAIF